MPPVLVLYAASRVNAAAVGAGAARCVLERVAFDMQFGVCVIIPLQSLHIPVAIP